MEERLTNLESRVTSLEIWRSDEKTRAAVGVEQWKHLIDRFDRVDSELHEMKGALWRILWIVLGSFLAAGVAWVVSGGLAVG